FEGTSGCFHGLSRRGRYTDSGMPLAGIISKPQKPELEIVLPELRAWLAERGWSSVLDHESAAYLHQHAELQSVDRAQMAERKPELVIVLGGDGTLLAA